MDDKCFKMLTIFNTIIFQVIKMVKAIRTNPLELILLLRYGTTQPTNEIKPILNIKSISNAIGLSNFTITNMISHYFKHSPAIYNS